MLIKHDLIYLVQTDTTVGFLSADKTKLNQLKGRSLDQPVLSEVDSLATLKDLTRVPNRFKNQVRRAKKSTFIYPNHKSFRVVTHKQHLGFLMRFKHLYSSSANKTKSPFEYAQALQMCDVLVVDSRGIFSGSASKIFKINQSKIKKIR